MAGNKEIVQSVSMETLLQEVTLVKTKLNDLIEVVTPMEINVNNLMTSSKVTNKTLASINTITSDNNKKQTEYFALIEGLKNSVAEANTLMEKFQNKQITNIGNIETLKKEKERISKDLHEHAAKLNTYMAKIEKVDQMSDEHMELRKIVTEIHGLIRTSLKISVLAVGVIGFLSILQFLQAFQFFGNFIKWIFN